MNIELTNANKNERENKKIHYSLMRYIHIINILKPRKVQNNKIKR